MDQCHEILSNSSTFLSKLLCESLMDLKVRFTHCRPLSCKHLVKICFCNRRWKDLQGSSSATTIWFRVLKNILKSAFRISLSHNFNISLRWLTFFVYWHRVSRTKSWLISSVHKTSVRSFSQVHIRYSWGNCPVDGPYKLFASKGSNIEPRGIIPSRLLPLSNFTSHLADKGSKLFFI